MKKEPIQFVYTNNGKWGSRTISWATREKGQRICETPSHFSILIWEWIIIESTLLYGVKPKLWSTFKDQNRILARFAPKDDKKTAANLAKANADRIRKAGYDYAAALYMGFYEVLNYYFDVEIPKENKFNSDEDFFCNEIYADQYGGDVSMKHPNSLMLKMLNDEKLKRLE